MTYPVVPPYVTVHLGAPDAAAENVTVSFTYYIKNVASSELYPTWPESALRANIYAQISVTLNRIFTEYYRSRGYDFDITSTTGMDQAFIKDREVFENIGQLVDEIFNDYIVRQGQIAPLYARFCDGVRTTCDGLSQWGSVALANAGKGAYEILQAYYGDDIDLVLDAPVGNNTQSYPGVPIRRGDFGEDVRIIKRELNRVGKNYPAIPAVSTDNDVYNLETETAVRTFQEIFSLAVDGIVGKATWYKLKQLYNGVKQLSEVAGEGLTLDEAARKYPEVLSLGDSGTGVRTVQYYLAFLGFFMQDLPQPEVTGSFDAATQSAVQAFQQKYGLTADGIVGRKTWNALQSVYADQVANLPEEYRQYLSQIYPGKVLSEGDSGSAVTVLQQALIKISANGSLPQLEATGTFDAATTAAVRAFQTQNGLEVTGLVGPITWQKIITAGNGFA